MIELEILNRLFIAIGISLSGWGLFTLYNQFIAARNSNRADDLFNGRSVLLYFTMPMCMPCKTVQAPIVEQVKTQLTAQIEVVVVDVTEQPSFASSWGVISVPTIFILDSQGKVRHINHGVTLADKLIKQLQGL